MSEKEHETRFRAKGNPGRVHGFAGCHPGDGAVHHDLCGPDLCYSLQFDGEHATDWRSSFCKSTGFAPRLHGWGPLLPYREIKHGDIIVFLSPAEPDKHLVKRVVGIPGDHIHLRHGIVYRNGEALKES